MSPSLAFLIGTVVLTVVGNLVLLRYLLARTLDTTVEELPKG
jgi:hypothetical protein